MSTYTYEFTAERPGTYFYHSHAAPDRQQGLGLYGALIVDPAEPSHRRRSTSTSWWCRHRNGYAWTDSRSRRCPWTEPLPNYFTINGKAYPATETTTMRVGERIRIRFIGTHNNVVHPMHVHGGPFPIIATDGEPVPEPAQLLKDTVNVGPGERYDVIWTARRPGSMAAALPHPPPHHQQQRRTGRRRWADGRPRRQALAKRRARLGVRRHVRRPSRQGANAMIVLLVLVGALVVALLLPTRTGPRPVRDAARLAMATAMVVAGVSHFTDTATRSSSSCPAASRIGKE